MRRFACNFLRIFIKFPVLRIPSPSFDSASFAKNSFVDRRWPTTLEIAIGPKSRLANYHLVKGVSRTLLTLSLSLSLPRGFTEWLSTRRPDRTPIEPRSKPTPPRKREKPLYSHSGFSWRILRTSWSPAWPIVIIGLPPIVDRADLTIVPGWNRESTRNTFPPLLLLVKSIALRMNFNIAVNNLSINY